MAGMLALAFLAIVLGAIYQDDDKLDDQFVVGAGTNPPSTAASGQTSGGSEPEESEVVGASSAIERFLPVAGEASACREQVGVDLAAGFGAKLTINGIALAPEELNVNLNPDGSVSNVITASRSLGQYTFAPDDNCPNGRLLRPIDNVLGVCVYRLEDTQQACATTTEHVFDAL